MRGNGGNAIVSDEFHAFPPRNTRPALDGRLDGTRLGTCDLPSRRPHPPRTPEMPPARDALSVPTTLLPRQRLLLVLASAILGAVLCVATA
jgi:hypothetical protein